MPVLYSAGNSHSERGDYPDISHAPPQDTVVREENSDKADVNVTQIDSVSVVEERNVKEVVTEANEKVEKTATTVKAAKSRDL